MAIRSPSAPPAPSWTAPRMMRTPPFDPERDLAAITLAINVQVPVVVPARSPYRSLQALLDAVAGATGAAHLRLIGNRRPAASDRRITAPAGRHAAGPCALSRRRAGRPGGAGGGGQHGPVGPAGLPLSQHRAGTVRILAVGSPQRLAFLPEVPTMAESGLPGIETSNWHGGHRRRGAGSWSSIGCTRPPPPRCTTRRWCAPSPSRAWRPSATAAPNSPRRSAPTMPPGAGSSAAPRFQPGIGQGQGGGILPGPSSIFGSWHLPRGGSRPAKRKGGVGRMRPTRREYFSLPNLASLLQPVEPRRRAGEERPLLRRPRRPAAMRLKAFQISP